jgi:hypothetical protein
MKDSSSKSSATQRYQRRFWPCMAAYVATMFGATWVFKHQQIEGVLRVALAALPALPVIAVVWVMGLYLTEETDEYLRLQLSRASLMATGLTLSACTLWGFLENFGVVAHVPLYFVFIGFCAALGLVQGLGKVLDR